MHLQAPCKNSRFFDTHILREINFNNYRKIICFHHYVARPLFQLGHKFFVFKEYHFVHFKSRLEYNNWKTNWPFWVVTGCSFWPRLSVSKAIHFLQREQILRRKERYYSVFNCNSKYLIFTFGTFNYNTK